MPVSEVVDMTYATFSIPIPCKPLHSIVISDQSRWILKLIRRLSLSSSLVTLDSAFVSPVFQVSSLDAKKTHQQGLPNHYILSVNISIDIGTGIFSLQPNAQVNSRPLHDLAHLLVTQCLSCPR
jgi:hypothetical protein